jgi:hypothetical protein
VIHDVNGSGDVTAQDVTLVRNRQATALPPGEPSALPGVQAQPPAVRQVTYDLPTLMLMPAPVGRLSWGLQGVRVG